MLGEKTCYIIHFHMRIISYFKIQVDFLKIHVLSGKRLPVGGECGQGFFYSLYYSRTGKLHFPMVKCVKHGKPMI